MGSQALNADLQGDGLFLDFAKVFDRSPHKILPHKLCNFGISGSLLAWSGDYLSNCKERIVVDGKWFSWLNLHLVYRRGPFCTPPSFFVIYIRGLPEVVSQGSTMALYADDCRTFRV